MKKVIFIIIIVLSVFSCRKENTKSIFIKPLDYTGKEISSYYEDKDYRLIIINYWATFCSPCKKEMVDLNMLYNNYNDQDVLILGVCLDGNKKISLMEKIIASLNVTYPNIYGVDNIFNGEEIIGVPATFILDKNGSVLERIDGKRDYSYFENIIKNNL